GPAPEMPTCRITGVCRTPAMRSWYQRDEAAVPGLRNESSRCGQDGRAPLAFGGGFHFAAARLVVVNRRAMNSRILGILQSLSRATAREGSASMHGSKAYQY